MKIHLAGLATFSGGSTKAVAVSENETLCGQSLQEVSPCGAAVHTSSLVDFSRLLAPRDGSTSWDGGLGADRAATPSRGARD